eukprot:7382693-Prymnesium_polylepis.1
MTLGVCVLAELQMIKARTMYNMVEEIDEGMCKLLFLTNAQADLIAKSPGSVQKMLDALEVGKPSLVIELCCSPGFRDAVRTLPLDPQACADSGWQGFIPDRPPFLDRTEERDAEAKIDMFMANPHPTRRTNKRHRAMQCDSRPLHPVEVVLAHVRCSSPQVGQQEAFHGHQHHKRHR